MQDCSISTLLAMKILQSCTKPSIFCWSLVLLLNSNQNIYFHKSHYFCPILMHYYCNIWQNTKAICNMAVICHSSGSLFGGSPFIWSWINPSMSLGYHGTINHVSVAKSGSWRVTCDIKSLTLCPWSYFCYMWWSFIWQIIQLVIDL